MLSLSTEFAPHEFVTTAKPKRVLMDLYADRVIGFILEQYARGRFREWEGGSVGETCELNYECLFSLEISTLRRVTFPFDRGMNIRKLPTATRNVFICMFHNGNT